MTKDIHESNNTLVARLREEGSDLSLEAADKIEALRRRGKFWHKATFDERGNRTISARVDQSIQEKTDQAIREALASVKQGESRA